MQPGNELYILYQEMTRRTAALTQEEGFLRHVTPPSTVSSATIHSKRISSAMQRASKTGHRTHFP